MKKIHNQIVLCIALLSFGTLHAQHTQEFSEILIGSWEGTGTLFSQKAEFSMTWESKLNDKFLMLNFENLFADQSGTEYQMQANAYYRFDQNKGYWFDSRGMMLPLSLEINKWELTVLWGNATTESGKTVYAIINDDQMHVKDFVLQEGAYVQFGDSRYKKSKE